MRIRRAGRVIEAFVRTCLPAEWHSGIRLNVTSQTLADLRRKRTKFESSYPRRFSLRRCLIERKQFSDAYAQKWEQLLVQQRDTLNTAIDQVSQFRGQLLQEEQISQKMTRTRNSRHN